MSVTSIDGQPVHYEAYGRGRPVLFVHGWLGSWRYWWPTMQAFSNHRRSFAVDLWGFGDSSKNVGDYGIESHVSMLDGFVCEMGLATPFTLVGHSLGAAIALRYARTAPTSVDRIAAVAMPISKEHLNGSLVDKRADVVIDQSRNRFSAYPEVVMGLNKANDEAIEQSIRQIDRLALSDDLLQTKCPVLLVYGSRDALVRQPANLSPNEKPGSPARHCVSLEDCSHFPMLEQPAVFNRLLREFIDQEDPDSLEPKNYWQRRTR